MSHVSYIPCMSHRRHDSCMLRKHSRLAIAKSAEYAKSAETCSTELDTTAVDLDVMLKLHRHASRLDA